MAKAKPYNIPLAGAINAIGEVRSVEARQEIVLFVLASLSRDEIASVAAQLEGATLPAPKDSPLATNAQQRRFFSTWQQDREHRAACAAKKAAANQAENAIEQNQPTVPQPEPAPAPRSRVR